LQTGDFDKLILSKFFKQSGVLVTVKQEISAELAELSLEQVLKELYQYFRKYKKSKPKGFFYTCFLMFCVILYFKKQMLRNNCIQKEF